MLHDPPLMESSAWHEASEATWAAFTAAVAAAAVARQEREAATVAPASA